MLIAVENFIDTVRHTFDMTDGLAKLANQTVMAVS